MFEIVLDCCCFINLHAAGDIFGDLREFGWSWYLPRAAAGEALYLRARDENGEVIKVTIDLTSLISRQVLKGVELETEEETVLYVRLASDLDDGEAMALAIAKQRGWQLATDDRKARRLAGLLDVETITTPEIMHNWADETKPDSKILSETLRQIEFRANFVPSEKSPDHKWWRSSVL